MKSKTIAASLPDSHFVHFPETVGKNFDEHFNDTINHLRVEFQQVSIHKIRCSRSAYVKTSSASDNGMRSEMHGKADWSRHSCDVMAHEKAKRSRHRDGIRTSDSISEVASGAFGHGTVDIIGDRRGRS